jgi:hypothetical protein
MMMLRLISKENNMRFASADYIRNEQEHLSREFARRLEKSQRDYLLIKAVLGGGDTLLKAADPADVLSAKAEANDLIAKHGEAYALGWSNTATLGKIAAALKWYNQALDECEILKRRSARFFQ